MNHFYKAFLLVYGETRASHPVPDIRSIDIALFEKPYAMFLLLMLNEEFIRSYVFFSKILFKFSPSSSMCFCVKNKISSTDFFFRVRNIFPKT